MLIKNVCSAGIRFQFIVSVSCRKYPVATIHTRTLDSDIELLGYRIPAKVKCNIGMLVPASSISSTMCYMSMSSPHNVYPQLQIVCTIKITFHVCRRLWSLLYFALPFLYLLPQTPIVYSEYTVTKDEKYFNEPNKFLPDRWKRGSENIHPFALLPFGYGPRACWGRVL